MQYSELLSVGYVIIDYITCLFHKKAERVAWPPMAEARCCGPASGR